MPTSWANCPDKHFPDSKKIALIQDNLSTHKPASLYEAFPAPEARRLVERFEWHYTPKHGSWLDLAESELSVLSGQCLDRRIADKQTLAEEIAAWEASRNKNHTKADRHFTTADARVKLKRRRLPILGVQTQGTRVNRTSIPSVGSDRGLAGSGACLSGRTHERMSH